MTSIFSLSNEVWIHYIKSLGGEESTSFQCQSKLPVSKRTYIKIYKLSTNMKLLQRLSNLNEV